MIKKVINKTTLKNKNNHINDLNYWRGRPEQERISAVEILRKQFYGSTGRLQRSVQVTKRS